MRRLSRMALLFAFFMLLPLAGGMGETISLKVTVNTADISFYDTVEGRVGFTVEGFDRTNYFDYPGIPYRVVSVLLPQGESVSSFDLRVLESVVVDEAVDLAPFEGDLLEDGTRAGIVATSSEVTRDGSIFPRWKVLHLGTNGYRGYRMAVFAIYPFQYDLGSGRLTLDRDLELVVETEPSVGYTDGAVRLRAVDGFRERNKRDIKSMVQNPEAVSTYIFSDIAVDDTDRGYLPSYLPSIEGSEVSYVIVTNEEMAPVFEELARWKTTKGVPAVVRTVEWIQQNYRAGADKAESIRNFIQDAYAKWGVEWVLLGGDTEVIPARYGYVTFYTGEFIPTDMYYSCLDGNWNADGDSLWGEAYHNSYDRGDVTDLYSEVYIGRMPVSNYLEAEVLVNKVMDYSEPVETYSKGKFMILGEVIFPAPYNPGDPIFLDGANIGNYIYTQYLEGNPDIVTDRQYETCDSYPGSICLTRASALDSMNAGTNHILHLGHGYAYNMSVGTGSILNVDADNLENGNRTFSMYLMNCTNAAFDMQCLAEYFLLNDNGGAYAVTGSSRSTFPSSITPYMNEYYDLLLAQGVAELGKCQTKSREPFTPGAISETADRWTHFIYNYLGDPEIEMFRGEPLEFTVIHPLTAEYGPNDITIEVRSEGMPFDSALVCLYKEGDDYAYGLTDISGSITFDDYLCRDEGYICVTVTGSEHGRIVDTIQVIEEPSPYLRYDSGVIVDDFMGNDDGVLDAGETVAYFLRLQNTGQGDAEKLYAVLHTTEPAVTLVDSVAAFPDMESGLIIMGLDGFIFSVDSDVEDEKGLEFELTVHDSTGGFWSETFMLEAHAPEIELYINDMSDEEPFGDGDGVIEPNEDFVLKIGVKNFGSGAAHGLVGEISTFSSNLQIVDNTSAYFDIPLLGVEYGDGFVLRESNIFTANMLELTLTDAHGRELTKLLELREPAPPFNVFLDAGYGPTEIHITWDPPDSLESYRYRVRHSLDQGGPYEVVTDDLVFYTLFNDYGLEPSTLHYFIVTTVDSCGNESVPSPEVSISTSPPQLAGWPNVTNKESSSSPKIADIDGDTHPDVVMGAEYIYAFHGNGIEIRDGDDQPVTWGILNTEGDNFTASVSLIDIDGNPGNEIVGASWNTKEIYVFDHDGNTLPGWPQHTLAICWSSPVTGDFDGNGDVEIFAFDIEGILYAWHHDGTELRDGDGDPLTNGPFFYRDQADTLGWHTSTPALADIDEDGLPELVVCAPKDSIYCLNEDASYVPGWPVPVLEADANLSASPAVGDIDGDGRLEVFVQSSTGWLYGLNHDGTFMTGWPKWAYSNNFFMGSPALADFTGDGKLEIVFPSMNGYCYIFDYLGNVMPGWPKPYNMKGGPTESSPTIADIDGDGLFDIILGCEEGILNAWSFDGNNIPGFPIFLSAYIRGTPMVRDLDLDGDVELIAACWDRKIYAWDLKGAYHRNYSGWNGFHGNIHNSGTAEFIQTTDATVIACAHRVLDGFVELQYRVPIDFSQWNIFRREPESEYEMLYSGLTHDGDGIVSYIDHTVEEGGVYYYRLEAEEMPDLYVETDEISVPVAHARLYQNHPNPFNPSTTIPFTVPGPDGGRSAVSLTIYDVRGSRVKTLVEGSFPTGRHSIQWDGRNQRGEEVSSGFYFVQLRTGGMKTTRKMVLIR
jgi:hypothetical protein